MTSTELTADASQRGGHTNPTNPYLNQMEPVRERFAATAEDEGASRAWASANRQHRAVLERRR